VVKKGSEYLWIKWFSIKEISVHTEKSLAAWGRYIQAGPRSISGATHVDNPDQKKALCELIDAIDGDIIDAWTMKKITKEAAKRHVMSEKT
jgi:hypothetical protein